jgi:hypothetical protein
MTEVQTANYYDNKIFLKHDADYVKVVFQFTVHFLNVILMSNAKQVAAASGT